ncbi:hypothetical protein FT643_10640 [Ketobacter sp. MCCC 1A13808]|uniref:hypothetical protein n=1 Tax=Ketobacter sp. MCCC 1A13808 TaxID=2602738 RepID=UPI000F2A262F|nr:hypothetical protein [Ketobacter sp. MCCC 1A13808]MVF12599.1 hypothetical protein [Ketobacter sp. MCCC 1A13808]RLP55602.1 MAG: hypothetical protein D6160_04150 [Ketobacter sp.]
MKQPIACQPVVDYRLAYRLSRKHDVEFLKSMSRTADMEQVLLSTDMRNWLSNNQCKPFDIINKLHILLELDKNEKKRHFGFQFRSQAMAFQIVYIDRFAWDKRVYRERLTGENCRKVQRMLHLFLFDEIHASKSQRLQIVRDMMLDHEPANEFA